MSFDSEVKEEYNKMEDDFGMIDCVSYMDFCKLNLVNEPKQEIIDKWVNEVVESYQRGTPAGIIMNLFEIPPKYSTVIENRNYKVRAVDVKNDTKEKCILIYLNLKVMPTSSLELN